MNNKFNDEIDNITNCVSSLHLVLQTLITLSSNSLNKPKTAELRLLRTKIRNVKSDLDLLQKSLLEKDDNYNKIKPILQQQYLDKKDKVDERE